MPCRSSFQFEDFEAQDFFVKAAVEIAACGYSQLHGLRTFQSGKAYEPTILDQYDCAIIQAILSGSSKLAWEESQRGLSARDLAMHVVLPELDGRILSRAIAFKEEGALDERTQYKPVQLVPHADRIDYVADLANGWATLRQTQDG